MSIRDDLIRTPPNYDGFPPPAPGDYYRDPCFGSTIHRVSSAMGTPNADGGGELTWITGEYSTICPFNRDNSLLILLHQSYFGLHYADAGYIRALPLEINASSQPRWSRTEDKVLYYVRGNELKSYNVGTGYMEVVRAFSEYQTISGKGEADISLDGDRFVFAGDNRHVFVYQLSTDRKSVSLDTLRLHFDSLYVTPDNNVTVTWGRNGDERYAGIELYDREMRFQRQITRAGGHMDNARDDAGDECLVWCNSNDPSPICGNGIVKVRLADGQQTCLLELPWNLAVHVSAPDNGSWALVTTYAPSDPEPGSPDWGPYTNEILRVYLDGSEVERLAHHRSRPRDSYNWQPRASVSRDGSRAVFNSNFNLQAIADAPNEYADVYMMRPRKRRSIWHRARRFMSKVREPREGNT